MTYVLLRGPCKDKGTQIHTRRMPCDAKEHQELPATQEAQREAWNRFSYKALRRKSTLLTSGFHTSSLQDCERRNSCCLQEFVTKAVGNTEGKRYKIAKKYSTQHMYHLVRKIQGNLSTFQKLQLTNSYQNELPDIQYLQSRRERGKCRRRKAVGSILHPLYLEHLAFLLDGSRKQVMQEKSAAKFQCAMIICPTCVLYISSNQSVLAIPSCHIGILIFTEQEQRCHNCGQISHCSLFSRVSVLHRVFSINMTRDGKNRWEHFSPNLPIIYATFAFIQITSTLWLKEHYCITPRVLRHSKASGNKISCLFHFCHLSLGVRIKLDSSPTYPPHLFKQV